MEELRRARDTMPQKIRCYEEPRAEPLTYDIHAIANGVPCPPRASALDLVRTLEEALRMAYALAEQEATRNRYGSP